jgi:N6-adenosine-specific RNA methylase IME4
MDLALELSQYFASALNKNISVVQCRVSSGVSIAFGGEEGKSAFIEVSLIGEIAAETKARIPSEAAEITAKYGVDAKKLFIYYRESGRDAWGWN